MPQVRLARILGLMAEYAGDSDTARLCAVSTEALGMSGAGIMLMEGAVARGSICSSNEVSELIEDLQFSTGEGPCVDAYHLDRPVLEPDLVEPEVPRWMAFTPPVVAAGARAVFGFPLHVGSLRLGALNLYRDQPGPLTDEQHADALVMAGVAAREVLAMQAGAVTDRLGAELESGADFRFVVHQASGMVSVQHSVTVAEALALLRARAFAEGQRLNDLAEDVVNGRVRFD